MKVFGIATVFFVLQNVYCTGNPGSAAGKDPGNGNKQGDAAVNDYYNVPFTLN